MKQAATTSSPSGRQPLMYIGQHNKNVSRRARDGTARISVISPSEIGSFTPEVSVEDGRSAGVGRGPGFGKFPRIVIEYDTP